MKDNISSEGILVLINWFRCFNLWQRVQNVCVKDVLVNTNFTGCCEYIRYENLIIPN